MYLLPGLRSGHCAEVGLSVSRDVAFDTPIDSAHPPTRHCLVDLDVEIGKGLFETAHDQVYDDCGG